MDELNDRLLVERLFKDDGILWYGKLKRFINRYSMYEIWKTGLVGLDDYWLKKIKPYLVPQRYRHTVKEFSDNDNNIFQYSLAGQLSENDSADISISGDVGSGKTTAIYAYACEYDIHKPNSRIEFINWADLKDLASAKAGLDEDAAIDWRRIKDADLLLLDDVGVGDLGTDARFTGITQLLNYRYEREDLITISSTNLNPENLITAIGERITYRIMSGYRIKMTGMRVKPREIGE